MRDYQLEGLAWMQFLREYEFAGILADDMGLGKTIQTLAHILTEKEAGRLTKPAMVVAPTSLMSNWVDEAARFAPDLSVLVLQGKDRLQRFDQIPNHDLVLTTYALLPRDEEMLNEHEYHLIILDESQYIKNMRSKSAQAAGLLRSRHRLCLTGTPLENHLGELWSQFHFLLPGLLGDEKGFNADFRNPIEKSNDEVRRELLTRRIKPFMLRRTKDKVAKELPPKTEIVRSVELSNEQRDMYETVRLAMDKKVRDEIAKKGVARSQIVILEALLKLRQVCCDPRLVKSDLGKVDTMTSSKLSELMEMLDELLTENRESPRLFTIYQHAGLDRGGAAGQAHSLRTAHRRYRRSCRSGSLLPARRRFAVPDQPESRRGRAEPDGGRHRHSLRSMVEPGDRKPGNGSRLADRSGQARLRLQADCQRYPGAKDSGAPAKESRSGTSHSVQRRSTKRPDYSGRLAGHFCATG